MRIFRRPTVTIGSGRATEGPRKAIKNVVIFGETGVGKSSLINLIAGAKVSETSSSAAGCTLDYKRHTLTLADQQFAIWDTAGLGEGTQGTVPAEKAEAYLKLLLRDLAKANGIDLLIYCVRGTRVRSALLTNYHLFYSAICRKKVPIAIAITGLENQEGNMETWWLQNKKEFSALQMHFDSHACVTTLESSFSQNAVLWERRGISKAALINMITSTCRTEQWKPAERTWAETAFADIRAILSPRDKNATHIANVILSDISQDATLAQCSVKRAVTFHNPISLSRSLTLPTFRNPISVMNEKAQTKLPFSNTLKCTPERLFRVYQVSRKQTQSKGKDGTKDMVVKRGADLLIFCVEKDNEGCRDVKFQWEHFNSTYGGDLAPQIAIVVGATDEESAKKWWNDVMGITQPGDASVTSWPVNGPVAEVEATRRRLRELINTRCIDYSKANFAGDKQIFRGLSPPTWDKGFISLRIKPPSTRRTSEVMTVARSQSEDVLTKWGVWEHISDG